MVLQEAFGHKKNTCSMLDADLKCFRDKKCQFWVGYFQVLVHKITFFWQNPASQWTARSDLFAKKFTFHFLCYICHLSEGNIFIYL